MLKHVDNRYGMKKSTKKWLIVIIVGVALIAAFLTGYNIFIADKPVQNSTANTQRIDDIKDNAPISSNTGYPVDSSSQSSDDIPVNDALNVKIVSISQQNGRVEAKASVSGSGTCVFQYTTDGDKPVISETKAKDQLCSSSINEVQFTKLGNWRLNVIYYSDSKKNETSTDVTIN